MAFHCVLVANETLQIYYNHLAKNNIRKISWDLFAESFLNVSPVIKRFLQIASHFP